MNEKDIDRIADKILEKLKNDTNKKDCYTETEAMLRSYPIYKINLKKNEEEIARIEEEGIITINSKPFFSENIKGGQIKNEGMPEKALNRIEYLKEENKKLEKRIFRVESAIENFRDDRYFKIIEMRYFRNFTIEEIATELNVSEKTIGRNRTRLIEKIQFLLFPEILID